MVRSNYSVCILDEDLEKGKRVLGNNFLISNLILYIPGHASLLPHSSRGPAVTGLNLYVDFKIFQHPVESSKWAKGDSGWAEMTVTAY